MAQTLLETAVRGTWKITNADTQKIPSLTFESENIPDSLQREVYVFSHEFMKQRRAGEGEASTPTYMADITKVLDSLEAPQFSKSATLIVANDINATSEPDRVIALPHWEPDSPDGMEECDWEVLREYVQSILNTGPEDVAAYLKATPCQAVRAGLPAKPAYIGKVSSRKQREVWVDSNRDLVKGAPALAPYADWYGCMWYGCIVREVKPDSDYVLVEWFSWFPFYFG